MTIRLFAGLERTHAIKPTPVGLDPIGPALPDADVESGEERVKETTTTYENSTADRLRNLGAGWVRHL